MPTEVIEVDRTDAAAHSELMTEVVGEPEEFEFIELDAYPLALVQGCGDPK